VCASGSEFREDHDGVRLHDGHDGGWISQQGLLEQHHRTTTLRYALRQHMPAPVVVVSGLPGSGKTTLGRQLAAALGLPLFDKDDILERLFESRGVGDAAWRRALSRESDGILQRNASEVDGAVVVSFWRLPGMPADTGTPTDWLLALTNPLVNVHCVCAPEIAARRFVGRSRHRGHLDGTTSDEDVLARLRALERFGHLDIGRRIEIDTSAQPGVDETIRFVRSAWTTP
jgi:glucokinase